MCFSDPVEKPGNQNSTVYAVNDIFNRVDYGDVSAIQQL